MKRGVQADTAKICKVNTGVERVELNHLFGRDAVMVEEAPPFDDHIDDNPGKSGDKVDLLVAGVSLFPSGGPDVLVDPLSGSLEGVVGAKGDLGVCLLPVIGEVFLYDKGELDA